ncbi:MAG: 30S ribosomal protein S8 [Polyangiales bacterium]|nr:30S ribosomal protein S8 [Myxococcales bacterium]
MLTDPIADMLTRIRNAGLARLESATLPHSKIKEHIAEILKQEGYIHDFKVEGTFPKLLTVTLRYDQARKSAVVGIRRKSRPGRREYVGYRDIPRVLNGMGISIVSTSRGLMTDTTARDQRMGGEILCEVW